jgi:hypothetical protein
MKSLHTGIAVVFSLLLISCDKRTTEAPIVVPPPPVPPVEEPVVTDPLMKQGLLLYYPFNSGPKDESGNGYDLQINGPVAAPNRFGELNGAYNFNGISDFMVIPPILKADSLRDLTISVWVRAADISRNVVLSFLLPPNMRCSSYMALDKNTGGFRTHHQMVTNYTTYTCTASVINDLISDPQNTWSHLVLVQRLYTQNSLTYYRYYQYINGKPLDSTSSSISNMPDKTIFTSGGIIGANNLTKDYRFNFDYFKGGIDDMRIYNRVLNEDEVKKLFVMKE